MLRYFAAAVPPKEVSDKIAAFSTSVDLGQAKVAPTPHIRVAYREGMDPYPEWEEVIVDFAAQTKPFTIKFGTPEYFGEFILVVPIISPELVAAHNASVRLLARRDKESRTEEEMQAFYETQSMVTPYMTLATGLFGSENFFGRNPQKNRILKKAKAMLKDLPSFEVTELALYEALVFNRIYDARGVVALGGQGGRAVLPALGLPQIAMG